LRKLTLLLQVVLGFLWSLGFFQPSGRLGNLLCQLDKFAFGGEFKEVAIRST